MIEFSGIAFRHVDNRVMSLQLVQLGLTNAAMFTADGEVLQPSEVLYKKADAGRARQLPAGDARQRRHAAVRRRRSSSSEPGVDGRARRRADGDHDAATCSPTATRSTTRDFLARADMLGGLGQDRADLRLLRVLPAGRLPRPLHQEDDRRSSMGGRSLRELFDEKYYADLDGGILESFGRLFKNDLKLYVYPLQDDATGALVTAGNLRVAPHLRHLYAYLLENHSSSSSATTTRTTCRCSRGDAGERSAPAIPPGRPRFRRGGRHHQESQDVPGRRQLNHRTSPSPLNAR